MRRRDEMDPFERAAHDRWVGNAARVHYGRCEGCNRVRDESGDALLVARQPRARRFLCLECFEFGPRHRREGADAAPLPPQPPVPRDPATP